MHFPKLFIIFITPAITDEASSLFLSESLIVIVLKLNFSLITLRTSDLPFLDSIKLNLNFDLSI